MKGSADRPDPYLSNLFMRRFGDIDRALPDVEAKQIRQAIDDADYRTACERLIEYFGEKSAKVLEERIAALNHSVACLHADIRELRQSNEAEHAEKLKYMDHSQRLLSLVDRLVQVVRATTDDDLFKGLVEEAEEYMLMHKYEINP